MDLEIQQFIKERIEIIDPTGTECDGATRLLSDDLSKNNIEHIVVQGTVEELDSGITLIPVHWWIELEPNWVLDIRLRMWLGESAPHGLFEVDEGRTWEHLAYRQEAQIQLSPLSKVVRDVLMGLDAEAYRVWTGRDNAIEGGGTLAS